MNLKASAIAAGILWGFLVFVFTIIEAARGLGQTLGKLTAIYVGYSVTYAGSLVGLVYGFVTGVLIGAAFCWLYNRVCGAAAQ